jgi:hypothetical protein
MTESRATKAYEESREREEERRNGEKILLMYDGLLTTW